MTGHSDERVNLARAGAVSLAEGRDVTSAQYQALRALLAGSVVSRFPRAGLDIEDVIDAAVEKFLAASSEPGKVRPETALAYLRAITRNEALDRLRKDGREVALGDEQAFDQPADDEIARMLSEHADAATVERLLKVRAQAGDWRATRVINEFLSLAESLGRTPSDRQVALRAEVSHPTVRRVLEDLRQDLRRNAKDAFPDEH